MRCSATDRPRWQNSVFFLCLSIAFVLSYQQVLDCGFIWDDDAYVTENVNLRDWSGLASIWLKPGATPQYYPLVHTTFWLEYHCWGLNASGYHVVNCTFHLASTFVLFQILRHLKLSPFLAVTLFAIHPIQVESVAWVTERKNVLSAFFYCLSALALLKWRLPDFSDAQPESRTEAQRKLQFYYWISFGAFVAALLSKTTACVLPAAAVVVIWWKSGQILASDFRKLLPFFAIGISFGLFTASMERWRVGAVGDEFTLTLLQRVLVASHAILFYLSKVFWPTSLIFVYPRWDFDSFHLSQLLPLILCVALTLILIYSARKGRRGFLAIWLLYVGSLFPALGFFNVYPMRYSFVADHFSYLSMLPLFAGIGCFLTGNISAAARYVRRLLWPTNRNRNSGVDDRQFSVQMSEVALCLLLAFILGPLTFAQTSMFRDLETLWRTTIQRNPKAWMAHHNLGILLEAKGKKDEALRHYQEAYSIKPDHFLAMNNAGLLQIEQGRFADAENILRQAISANPAFDRAHNNLAISLVRQGRLQEALVEFDTALAISPGYRNAKINRAAVVNAMKPHSSPSQ